MTVIKSAEPGISFEVAVERVEPTEEERNRRWTCEMATAEEQAASPGWSVGWFQTKEVIEPLIEPDWSRIEDDDEDFPAVSFEVAAFSFKVCKIGSRYPIFMSKRRSFLDSGDGSCDVSVEESEL